MGGERKWWEEGKDGERNLTKGRKQERKSISGWTT